MNFLSRMVRPRDPMPTADSHRMIEREIEITVERSWTAVSRDVRSPQDEPLPPITPPPSPAGAVRLHTVERLRDPNLPRKETHSDEV